MFVNVTWKKWILIGSSIWAYQICIYSNKDLYDSTRLGSKLHYDCDPPYIRRESRVSGRWKSVFVTRIWKKWRAKNKQIWQVVNKRANLIKLEWIEPDCRRDSMGNPRKRRRRVSALAWPINNENESNQTGYHGYNNDDDVDEWDVERKAWPTTTTTA